MSITVKPIKATIIVTFKNEEKTLHRLVESLLKQSYKANEIILVDGGSTDKSIEQLKKFKKRVKCYYYPSNRACARNYAIEKAKNELIAITDAGCLPNKDWLEQLIKCHNLSKDSVIAGYYYGISQSAFQKCLVPYFLVMPDKLRNIFLPATRSMLISKTNWKKNGKFPEKYNLNEDYVFARGLLSKGLKISFCQKAVVGWFPPESLQKSFRTFFNFARGDVEAGIIRVKVIIIFLRSIFFFYIVTLNIESITISVSILYVFWSIKKNYKYINELGAFVFLPIIQITSDIAIFTGSILGLVKSTSDIVSHAHSHNPLSQRSR